MYEETFKSSLPIFRAVLTGVYNIAYSSLGSTFNNAKIFSISSPECVPYYGFNEKEVDALFDLHEVDQHGRSVAKKWYNGYTVTLNRKGSHNIVKGEFKGYHSTNIYNPYSLGNFLLDYASEQQRLDPQLIDETSLLNYWTPSSGFAVLKPLLSETVIRDYMEQLWKGEPVRIRFRARIDDTIYSIIKRLLTFTYQIEEKDPAIDILFSYLLQSGYLTFDPKNIQSAIQDGSDVFIKLPNEEVKMEWKNALLDFYKETFGVPETILKNAATSITNLLKSTTKKETYEAVTELHRAFTGYVNSLPEFSKKAYEKIEKGKQLDTTYGNEMRILCSLGEIVRASPAAFNIALDALVNNKKPDCMFTDEFCNTIVIIELKFADGTAANALDQIIEREYAQEYIKKGLLVKIIGLSVDLSKQVLIDCIHDFKKEKIDVISLKNHPTKTS